MVTYMYSAEKALTASFICLRKYAPFGTVTHRVGLQLYDSFVTPVTEYACDIWSKGNHIELGRIQTRFLKMLLGGKTNTTCCMATYVEMGRYPVVIRH